MIHIIPNSHFGHGNGSVSSGTWGFIWFSTWIIGEPFFPVNDPLNIFKRFVPDFQRVLYGVGHFGNHFREP